MRERSKSYHHEQEEEEIVFGTEKKLSTSVITRETNAMTYRIQMAYLLGRATSGKWKSRLLVIYVIYNSYLCVTC